MRTTSGRNVSGHLGGQYLSGLLLCGLVAIHMCFYCLSITPQYMSRHIRWVCEAPLNDLSEIFYLAGVVDRIAAAVAVNDATLVETDWGHTSFTGRGAPRLRGGRGERHFHDAKTHIFEARRIC